MKAAFLTETNHEGYWDVNMPNCRTEIAWQVTLNAYHYNIFQYEKVKNYDCVFIIIPKGKVFLSADGTKISNENNPFSGLISSNFTEVLKNNNKKLCFIQEGGVDRHINDYSIEDQFNYFNHIQNCDIIFAHNEYDTLYYKGMFPQKKISIMSSLMLEHLIKNITWNPQNKIMIGGNMSHFYRGFQSYIISNNIKDHEKWTMTSHAMRENENQIQDLNHLPRVTWIEWMYILSNFKFGIHLMDLRAAGTFALNCGYYGIIVIGNNLVDTYKLIYPEWCVDVYNMEKARELSLILNEKRFDVGFLKESAEKIKCLYKKHFSVETWKNKILSVLHE